MLSLLKSPTSQYSDSKEQTYSEIPTFFLGSKIRYVDDIIFILSEPKVQVELLKSFNNALILKRNFNLKTSNKIKPMLPFFRC